ncbi:biogenesis of lysosome-related organelles complex 1 subunit 1-like [Mytilus edulis]|uniref:biogenesis of lysosome-related organelles complex 1 subunit 1-like n=1 Tax=Mytilus edulis TaxID=6550 RepID=UPI0039F01601
MVKTCGRFQYSSEANAAQFSKQTLQWLKLVEDFNTAQKISIQLRRLVQTKILQANAAQFSKQTLQWLKLVEDFNTAQKELGDVENWAKSIEADMRTLSSALEYVYRKNNFSVCLPVIGTIHNCG